jgi:hypothetical protein
MEEKFDPMVVYVGYLCKIFSESLIFYLGISSTPILDLTPLTYH